MKGMNPFMSIPLCLTLLATGSCAEALRTPPADEPVDMFIESCSLGCSDGGDGTVVFCSLINTFQNGDIALRFSQPIDPASIDASTFQIVEAATGIPPEGQVMLNPLDERGLLYRPGLTFDASGVPVYGLRPGAAYRLRVHGMRQGDAGPFLRSRSGAPNQSRLDCTIVTDQGILDLVTGPPTVEVFADVVTAWDAQGEPSQVESARRVPRFARDLVDVHRASPLRFVFGELMNPGTLAINSSGQAPFVRVEVDGDGLLATAHDRSLVPGHFQVEIDLEGLSTELTFWPTFGYPSAGPRDMAPGAGATRFVLLTIPPGVTDLAGNAIEFEGGGGRLAFTQERLDFETRRLPSDGGVDFEHDTGDPEGWADAWRTGAEWGAGLLRPGIGGGSGRLGELIVRAGQVLTLDTDHQAFPLAERALDVCGNRDLAGQYPGEGDAQVIVSDGVFEFAALRIESGARLVLRGRQPARLLVSGPLVVHQGGIVDLSGESPEGHDSSIALPEQGLDVRRIGGAFVPLEVAAARGRAGPGAGDGGYGGDRHDFGPAPEMLDPASFDLDSDARDLTGFPVDGYGRRGQGVGGEGEIGGGGGGARASVSYPTTPSTLPEMSGSSVAFNIMLLEGDDVCLARQLGGAGAGGGYATPGTAGRSSAEPSHSDYPIGGPNGAAPTPGGQVTPGFLGPPGDDSAVRQLGGAQHEFLRGGAGGGGGGTHCYQTRASGLDGPGSNACIGIGSPFVEWHDHSGAPGGGGGGACTLTSGVSIRIDGEIDASGGAGGSYAFASAGRFALPGGGGAGGGVRLQSRTVALGGGAGHIDVHGGAGGEFLGGSGVRGGAGGTGLVRVEDLVGQLDRHLLALAISPFDALDDSLQWLSVGAGAWAPEPGLPEPMSAATSCWIHPEGLFYTLVFEDDRGQAPGTQGWNMELEWSNAAGVERVPYRGANPWYPTSIEEALGNVVGEGTAGGGSPVAVRFQGARAAGVGDRLCERALDGANSAAQEGTATPWVSHPSELNAFEPRPDMLRFMVIFDPTAPAWEADGRSLHGVTGLWVGARPE
ncbi:MAG: hypothetical protein ACI8QZ_002359 [Chlamydiales bacterium]|jgi:hypothetical protein